MKTLYSEFIKVSEEAYPNEACGFIIKKESSSKAFLRLCVNEAEKPTQEFKVSPKEYLAVKKEGKIVAIFHSHPNFSAHPSDADKRVSENLDLPSYICSYPHPEICVYEPNGYVPPMVGRVFSFGINDCYTLVRDYFKQELNLMLADYEREDYFWERGEDLYLDNFAKEGFKEVDDGLTNLKKHDLLLCCIESTLPNHAAIYLGDGNILHHINNRLSSKQPLSYQWVKYVHSVIRHKSQL